MILLQQNKKFNRRFLRITSSLGVYISQRYTCLIAAGTQLIGFNRQPLALILTYHNIWLRSMRVLDIKNIDMKMILFIQQKYAINPKLLQHFFGIGYPRHLFSLIELNVCFPEINIIDPKSNLYVGFDVVLPLVVASTAMKKDPIFKDGKISVLGFPDEQKQKRVFNSLEYQQTGQPNPDYLYQFNTKTNIWQRYYDFKTGHIAANKGHIFCAREGQQYEELCENILNAQKTCYKKNTIIYEKLTNLIQNKKLTWGERNESFHIFLRENMSKFSDINPSLIIKSDILYELDANPLKSVLEIVNLAGPGCMESYEKSINVIANSIFAGGKICVHNYSQIKSANPKIVQILKHMTSESIEYLLNNT